jgi:hypothetical protein
VNQATKLFVQKGQKPESDIMVLSLVDADGNGYQIHGATEKILTDPKDVLNALKIGSQNRGTKFVRVNNMQNAHSHSNSSEVPSRSFFIFDFNVAEKKQGSGRHYRIRLVDLCGFQQSVSCDNI